MDRETILVRLEEIFRDIFDDPALKISESTNSSDISDWDSLNHINLISAIEKKFQIRFALGELQTLKNVGQMADLMITKLQRSG